MVPSPTTVVAAKQSEGNGRFRLTEVSQLKNVNDCYYPLLLFAIARLRAESCRSPA